MLDIGVIEPAEGVEWVCNLHVVFKIDKDARYCVDFRQLNDATVDDIPALPHIDDILDSLIGCWFFTILDLKKGFWQVILSPETAKLCNFCTARGIY